MSNITDDASLTYAPSCTIEDAALYLMGVPQSHLQPQLWKSSDDPLGGEWFSLKSYLDLAIEYDAAKFALEELQATKHKITQKLAKLEDGKNNRLDEAIIKKQTELDETYSKYKKAHSYKTAIINEIAKGTTLSNLHIDNTATKDISNPYITLLSLKKWAKSVFKISILNDLDTTNPLKPLPAMRQQENAIVDAIRKLDLDPKKLPKNPSGKPGVKAAVRQLVQYPPLFINVKVFDRAWDRLSKYKEIIILK